MTVKNTGRIVFTIFIALFAFALSSYAGAQAYKTIDEDGNVKYTDSPSRAKKKNRGDLTISGSEPEEQAVEPEIEGEQLPAREREQEKRATGEVIVVGGDIDIETSVNGYAEISATIKNVSKIAVDGLRLDVILFLAQRKRGADLAIPFTGGKKTPDLLEPGETGKIVYETSLEPEEISGRRFRLVWNVYELQTIKKVPKSEPTLGE